MPVGEAAADVRVVERLDDAVGVAHQVDVVRSRRSPSGTRSCRAGGCGRTGTHRDRPADAQRRDPDVVAARVRGLPRRPRGAPRLRGSLRRRRRPSPSAAALRLRRRPSPSGGGLRLGGGGLRLQPCGSGLRAAARRQRRRAWSGGRRSADRVAGSTGSTTRARPPEPERDGRPRRSALRLAPGRPRRRGPAHGRRVGSSCGDGSRGRRRRPRR